ncbi:DUF2271 domain-containing protein [Pseudoalteromonas fenneropenaei]|uniref:DUF2271 domain-containing protein n=1 Tax=Pseudoalteromonas fenneropenaei TaxID=1737459 RepID=A0ABV7CJA8_9GAMM
MNIKQGVVAPLFLAAATFSAAASELNVTVEIPKMSVAEYHKPYLAVWIEDSQNQVVSNLAVWYDEDMRNGEGEKWLKDMRQWWRRTGRTLTMPVDGVTGATRGPGQHALQFTLGQAPLQSLAAGDYQLRVEAAREVGGRELLNIPFSWPQQAAVTLKASGNSELGDIALTINP